MLLYIMLVSFIYMCYILFIYFHYFVTIFIIILNIYSRFYRFGNSILFGGGKLLLSLTGPLCLCVSYETFSFHVTFMIQSVKLPDD